MIIRQDKARSVTSNLKSVVRFCEAVYIRSLYLATAPKRKPEHKQIMLSNGYIIVCTFITL